MTVKCWQVRSMPHSKVQQLSSQFKKSVDHTLFYAFREFGVNVNPGEQMERYCFYYLFFDSTHIYSRRLCLAVEA